MSEIMGFSVSNHKGKLVLSRTETGERFIIPATVGYNGTHWQFLMWASVKGILKVYYKPSNKFNPFNYFRSS